MWLRSWLSLRIGLARACYNVYLLTQILNQMNRAVTSIGISILAIASEAVELGKNPGMFVLSLDRMQALKTR